MNPNNTLTARRIAAIRLLMAETVMSSRDLAIAANFCRNQANRYIAHMRSAGMMHIDSWDQRTAGDYVARYRLGAGKDARKPEKKSLAKRARDERARMKLVRKDPAAYGLYLSKQRARHMKERAVKAPSPWFAALPGSRAIQGAQP